MDCGHAHAERLRVIQPAQDIVDGAERQVQAEPRADGVGDGLARLANRGQFMDFERWLLALGIEDRLANLGWEQPVLLPLRRRDEAGHPDLLKLRHLEDRALRQSSFRGTCGRGLLEEHDRTNELVGPLPRFPRERGDLVPIVCWFDLQLWGHAA
jgi:hypothetical protein